MLKKKKKTEMTLNCNNNACTFEGNCDKLSLEFYAHLCL